MITSCESAIEYKGPKTDPVLVVSATAKADNDSLKTRVAVSRSYFFLDKTEKFHYNGYEFSYNGYLDNAVVEMRTDNGKWYRLGKTKTPGIYEYNLKGIPQDSITLKVSHKDYGTAVTTQTVPGKVNATIEEIKVRDKRVYLRLKTEPYTGYDNDIIQLCGTFPYYILMPITNYDIDKTTGEYLYTDSVSIQTVLDEKNRIYSEDFIFNELQTSSNGIYSGTALLFRPQV